jgi:hypothetical protein
MTPATTISTRHLYTTLLAASFFVTSSSADVLTLPEASAEAPRAADIKTTDPTKSLPPENGSKDKKLKARLFLTNGDRLSGLPESINEEKNLLFQSDSLRQTASFPLANIISINFDSWKHPPSNQTIARVQLQPRFRESKGDTILGALRELTPDSIKIDTWYGGIITLKRSMVLSLNIINNSPGNYYGPNNIKEWNLSGGDYSWSFQNGTLVSHGHGSIGRDMGLREKSHISFDATWKSRMQFKIQLYSNDTQSKSPSAYYEINLNHTSAYLRTRGKTNGRAAMLGGGRWKQLNIRPKEHHAHFDFYVNRKVGSITVYINGIHACALQSQSPDPENLGKGLAFIAEKNYSLEIKDITVTHWNGTTLPKSKAKINQDTEKKDKKTDSTKKSPPHKIILNNGDEVPGTVGKVEDDRMIIETQFTPIHIPLNRIKSLSLGDKGEEPIKKRGDVRAWFHDGGHITLQLASFKENKISGHGQAFGDVTLDLSAFRQIDFHIYDDQANKLRKKVR